MSIKLKDTVSDLINKANKDGSGNTITSTYLKKTGDVLSTKGEQYNGNYGINLNNSDIIGANSITFNDYCESSHEGIRFCRSDVSGKYDAISARNGVFYFSPNGTISTADTTGSFPTDYVVLHSNNWNNYCAASSHTHTKSQITDFSHTHEYLPLSGGTLTSNNNVLNIKGTENSYIYYYIGSTKKASTGYYSNFAFLANENTYARIGIADNGTPQYHTDNNKTNVYTLLHSGNYSTWCSPVHSHPYLPLSGGTMDSNASIVFKGSGGIEYRGSKGHYQMIGFLDNTGDAYGDGIRIGGGGTVIVGAGESSTALVSNSIVTDFNDENLHLSADYNIIFYSNCNTIGNRKSMTFDNGGTLSVNGTAVSLSGHTHGYASKVTVGSTAYNVSSNNITIPAYPTSLKCPASLTIQLNGTSQGAWDGSAAKTINITPSSIGAAASHTHPYLSLAGGTMNSGACITFANGNGATVALNLTNSFIVGVNSLVLADSCNGSQEGIQFPRADNSAKYDSLWVKDGVAYLGVNAASYTEAAGTNYTLIHSGNYTSYLTTTSSIPHKSLTYSTMDNLSGIFTYSATLSDSSDTTGIQIGDNVTKMQLDAPHSTGLRFRVNDTGGTNTSWASWYYVLHEGNWSSYCAPASHSHSYLPLSGGTITQSEWGNGIKLNRSVAGAGCSIVVQTQGTEIGKFGINGSKIFEVDLNGTSNVLTCDSGGNLNVAGSISIGGQKITFTT